VSKGADVAGGGGGKQLWPLVHQFTMRCIYAGLMACYITSQMLQCHLITLFYAARQE
jgi:hypothetical protein